MRPATAVVVAPPFKIASRGGIVPVALTFATWRVGGTVLVDGHRLALTAIERIRALNLPPETVGLGVFDDRALQLFRESQQIEFIDTPPS
jgi:hypothetical protein